MATCLFFVEVAVVATAAALPPSTELVSKASVGNGSASSNGLSDNAAVSADGRYIAFQSSARNLVAAVNYQGAGSHIFLKDRSTGIVTLVTARSQSGENIPAAQPGSGDPSISADGRFITYTSPASDLVSSDTNGKRDIFIYDRINRSTVRVPGRFGEQPNGDSVAPTISGDGRFLAFQSAANNLTSADTNNTVDVFRFNRVTGGSELVSRAASGGSANGLSEFPSISQDGNKVAYHSTASNLVASDSNAVRDVFVRIMNGATSSARVSLTVNGSQANGESVDAAISADGTAVAFASLATNLTAAADTNSKADIFRRAISGSTLAPTTRVSRSTVGDQSNGSSTMPTISADGSVVAFSSTASNLVSQDNNGKRDVFVARIDCGLFCTTLASMASDGGASSANSENLSLSTDGRLVLFRSQDRLTSEPDENFGAFDIYMRSTS